jgi:5-methylcytosine-specific restriction endonuclease McrA
MKIDRESIHQKFGGHCSYCGKEITLKQMQVDHFIPVFRGWENGVLEGFGLKRGDETIDNLFPSCARCNRWKSTWNIEQFRNEISLQIQRLNQRSNNYRMAKDFGLIEETNKSVLFFFETYTK